MKNRLLVYFLFFWLNSFGQPPLNQNLVHPSVGVEDSEVGKCYHVFMITDEYTYPIIERQGQLRSILKEMDINTLKEERLIAFAKHILKK